MRIVDAPQTVTEIQEGGGEEAGQVHRVVARLETEVDRGTKVEQAEQVARAELMGLKNISIELKTTTANISTVEQKTPYSRVDGTDDPHGRAENHYSRAKGAGDHHRELV